MSLLFGVSANGPVDPGAYLDLLRPHGCDISPAAGGWGVAVFEGNAARLFKQTGAYARAQLLCLLRGQAFRSQSIIAHSSAADSQSNAAPFADSQPFEREVGGRSQVFAHDGELAYGDELDRVHFHPMGRTTSERAFCALLDVVRNDVPKRDKGRDAGHLTEGLALKVSAINASGTFNFLLSDGEHLYAHAHTALHAMEQVACDGRQEVALVCSTPMTDDDGWQPLPANTLSVFKKGRQIAQMRTENEAPAAAWADQRSEMEAVQSRRRQAEEHWRKQRGEFDGAMGYNSG